ncbi:restriction endonuclease subunit S [Xanthobacter variabilis]|uniref:restriction endonuclease subunit S n=1 Tax=Xanthobacter variabilis TaxID=3119932 RepID=UPI00374E644D
MIEWTTIELGQLAEFRNGLNYSAADNGLGLAVVGVSDFQDKLFVDFSCLAELNPSALSTSDALIRKNDIIFVRSNGNRELIGRSLLVLADPPKPTSHSGFTIRLRFTDRRADPRFFAYFLRGGAIRSHLSSQGGGTNINNLNQGILSRLTVPLPPIETQRRIASILGAYDDLIEVNRRRIAVLEEMARGLFEEWFVRFRFPGHEVAAIEDTPDGPLPAGWSWGTAGDLLLFDPRTRVPREGEKPFIPMGHLDTSTSLIAEPETRDGNSGSKFQNGDTLFARITPCLENGKTGLVRNLPGPDGVGFGSTEFIVMRGGRAGPAFTYCLSRLPAFRDHARMSMSGATGRQRARTDSVADFAIAIPPTNNLFDRFEKAAWPILELVGQIGSSNKRLAAARDLLLPRLISGQLSVTQAERELKAA